MGFNGGEAVVPDCRLLGAVGSQLSIENLEMFPVPIYGKPYSTCNSAMSSTADASWDWADRYEVQERRQEPR